MPELVPYKSLGYHSAKVFSIKEQTILERPVFCVVKMHDESQDVKGVFTRRLAISAGLQIVSYS